ncbi:MAG: putative phage tail protein [Bacteroides sp.]
MPLYDNAFPSNYDEIKTYYPVWYFDVLEMDAVWRAEAAQLDRVQSSVEALLANGFVGTADEATLTALEKFLHIETDPSKALAERRRLVSSFFSGDSHIGSKEIKETVSTFTDGKTEVSFANSEIHVRVTRDMSDRLNLSDCLLVLKTRIPAHLLLSFEDNLLPIPLPNKRGAYRLDALTFSTSFSNAAGGEVILLDGRRAFDGTWLFNQSFSGLAFPCLTIRASCSTAERLTAAMTFDSMYHLDGSVLFDGSRKFNAQITKEAI